MVLLDFGYQEHPGPLHNLLPVLGYAIRSDITAYVL